MMKRRKLYTINDDACMLEMNEKNSSNISTFKHRYYIRKKFIFY